MIEHTQVQSGSARFGNPGLRAAFDAIVCANYQQTEQRRLAAGFRPAQTRPLTVLFMGEAGAPAGS